MSLIAWRWRWCSCCLPGGAMSGCQRLRHPPAGQLDVAHVEGRLQLQERHCCSRSKTVAIVHSRYRTPTPYPAAAMAGEPIFQMYKLSKVHPPDREVLKDISLSFLPGAKIGVLGYNGSGKSSLLRDHGRARPRVPRRRHARAGRHRRTAGTGAAPGRVQGRARQRARGGGRRRRARRALQRACGQLLGRDGRRVRAPAGRDRRGRRLEPRRAARARDGRAALPAGATRRSARCRAASAAGSRSAGCCCAQPDLLLLDEPTNHLDAESVEWLEQHLAEYKGTVVAVTHDRYFLDNVAGWILELDRGRGIPYEGNYSGWLEQKQARLAQDEKQEIARQRTIAAELEWVRTNPKGRRTKSKARLASYEELLAEERRRQARPGPDPHPRRPAPRRRGDRGRATCARASASAC